MSKARHKGECRKWEASGRGWCKAKGGETKGSESEERKKRTEREQRGRREQQRQGSTVRWTIERKSWGDPRGKDVPPLTQASRSTLRPTPVGTNGETEQKGPRKRGKKVNANYITGGEAVGERTAAPTHAPAKRPCPASGDGQRRATRRAFRRGTWAMCQTGITPTWPRR